MQDNNLKRIKSYCRIKHNIALFELAFILIFLSAFQLSGLSANFKQFALFLSNNKEILTIAIYLLIFSISYNIFSFWFDYFSGYKIEHKFGLSRQNFLSWFKDYIKKLSLGGALSLITIEILYLFMREFPYTWWLWAASFWLFFSLFLARIFPVFIIPLFYKLERLKDQNLREKLLTLANKSNVKILDIYKIDLAAKTKKANAALVGVGRAKRILISDTLLNNYTPEEVETTLAHELAHHKYRHFWKLILFNIIETLIAFLLIHLIFNNVITRKINLPIYDIQIFPILIFIYTIFNIIIMPLSNVISRYFEKEADKKAIELTNKPSAFISLIEKLTRQNLSDPSPSLLTEIFFYDHPPASKRIKAAQQQ